MQEKEASLYQVYDDVQVDGRLNMQSLKMLAWANELIHLPGVHVRFTRVHPVDLITLPKKYK